MRNHTNGSLRRLAVCLAGAAVLSAPAVAECRLTRLSEMPVTMRTTKPIIDVKANGQDLRLVLDTGAFWSTLSYAKADELELKLRMLPQGLRITGIGGTARARIGKIEAFEFAEWTLDDPEFIVTGIGVGDGLLGQNILSLLDYELDLSNGMLRLFHTDDCRNAALAYWAQDRAYNVVDLISSDAMRNLPVVYVYVNGKRLRALIDTGAAATLMSTSAARRAGIDLSGPDAETAGAVGGIGRQMREAWSVRMDMFKIGDQEVQNARVRVADANLPVDMILGSDFIIAHRMFVSNEEEKIFFTYEGGQIFNSEADSYLRDENGDLIEATPIASDEPTDAEGYASRGAARHELNDYEAAEADFAMAIDLEPDRAAHYFHRARTRLALQQPKPAMDDVNKAIELEPDHAEALIMRATMRQTTAALLGEISAAGLADAQAASAALPAQSGMRLQLGSLFGSFEREDLAIREYTNWIDAHREDVRLPIAYNGRCWARALTNVDLDDALDDCNQALKRMSDNPAFLDSRGLVRLRRGEFGRAIDDYDKALEAAPGQAWSLYGRSLAHRALGHEAEADADLAAAKAARASIVEDAAKRGL